MNGLSDVTHLTFDCYGTLIDWEAGILGALEPWRSGARGGVPIPPEILLRTFVAQEARIEAGAWRPYRLVLREVFRAMAEEHRWNLSAAEQDVLAETLPKWPPFPDTVAALRRLKERFKLVIVSNTDDDLFAATARRLEVGFDGVITAEQVRCYKPGLAHFEEVLKRFSLVPSQVLHVAQSLYHDHGPAKRLGWRTVWVQRPSRLAIQGLAPPAVVKPDATVTSLAELAEVTLD
jgi:2-haloacid dehalogenase